MTDRRGLVIDFGGVLTAPLGDAFRAFCEREGIPPERLSEFLHASYPSDDPDSIVIQVETGRMSPEDFEERLAAILSEGLDRAIRREGLLERMGETLELEDRMIEAVRRAHEHGVKTALLSNSWGLHYYPHDLLGELFDEIVISGQVGMRKPDEDIYHLACEGLGLPPEACVFVDDIEANVVTAEKVGMHGLLHRTPDESIPELERLLGVAGLDSGPG
jgi:epoxide hydrolase-like predicted phosphatase